ncbi:M20 aminoacylase family protein [Rhodoligotrophos defluvii]|uniref:M20 aminoacylase family protein n=1 Tax=Rhodoligotrophos defluvii TaxID=2561934 RepID=UPI0010C9AE40|nr:M20 aminoacylase family protein [Rhodoligotrophos defluvii]
MPIKPEIAEFDAEMRAWRRDLHAHPELGFEEARTSAFVAKQLKAFGLDEVVEGVGGTGVVGVLHGLGGPADNSGPRIGFRADMDALPIEEENELAYRSTVPGKMHACGHDGHTTMLLGAAKYLAGQRKFRGTVYFIFQPAEEGLGGAQRMLDDGLFERFPCDGVYGLHNWPQLPAGVFAVRSGPVMAAADRFDVTVRGRGAHGAMPHLAVDPLLAAVNMVSALQSIVSRNVDPVDTAVVSVTQIHSGTTHNIIPAEATFGGTARSFRPDTRDFIERRIREIVASMAEAHGTTAALSYVRQMSATINSPQETEWARAAAADVVGADAVRTDVPPSMGAEDFGDMLLQRPGNYIWLGQGRGPNEPMLHTSRYDFNDEVLSVGASYWVSLAEALLPARPRG